MNKVIRKGKFFGLFCNNPEWIYVYHTDWATSGTTFYRWCKKCDRLEKVGFLWTRNDMWYEPGEYEEELRELGLPTQDQMVPYVSGPGEVDLIHLRTVAGFIKD